MLIIHPSSTHRLRVLRRRFVTASLLSPPAPRQPCLANSLHHPARPPRRHHLLLRPVQTHIPIGRSVEGAGGRVQRRAVQLGLAHDRSSDCALWQTDQDLMSKLAAEGYRGVGRGRECLLPLLPCTARCQYHTHSIEDGREWRKDASDWISADGHSTRWTSSTPRSPVHLPP